MPVIKHLPGHGRATVDSHKELPRVDTPRDELSSHDIKAFKLLKLSALGDDGSCYLRRDRSQLYCDGFANSDPASDS
ncbi:glycoside hydrolase family 3 N-terminal domain-containing protein [Kiloniella litopenaei]|uniref:glycoside hydrolase family 3 N-terminal domain-containing protein n=1 Tax=Kiloniella litopenaei TaxID=1549748 RepID=UPI003BAD9268